MDICLICGGPVNEDTSIFIESGARAVCRECFNSSKFRDLAASVVAQVYLEAALDETDRNPALAADLCANSLSYEESSIALSHLAYLTRDPRRARALLERSLAIDKHNMQALLNMPMILAAVGEYALALDWLEKVSSLGDVWDTNFKRARFLRALGRAKESEEAYNQALRNPCLTCRKEYERQWLSPDLWEWGITATRNQH
ncbi:MAG: hypothetical protein JO317_05080 [Verrucomicrobiae bacterium]|nr:hypothetical protein [Verrucomicrobiae bacterium]